MQYLVKVFGPGESIDFTPHVVTDDGDSRAEGSLWYWIAKAARQGIEISVYRMIEDISEVGALNPTLIIDKDGGLTIAWFHNAETLAGLKAEGSNQIYVLENVLDLS